VVWGALQKHCRSGPEVGKKMYKIEEKLYFEEPKEANKRTTKIAFQLL